MMMMFCGLKPFLKMFLRKLSKVGSYLWFLWPLVSTTGWQPPPLSSVLYGIISERRFVLAAQLLLREKSGASRVDTDSNIPSLPGGSMKFIWWKLKMSYHTAYPSWDCPAVVCHLFLYSFIYAPTTSFTWLSKIWTSQLSSVFLTILGPLLVQGFIFEKGPTIFKFLRIQFV